MKIARDSERKIKYDDVDNGFRPMDIKASAEGRGKYVRIAVPAVLLCPVFLDLVPVSF